MQQRRCTDCLVYFMNMQHLADVIGCNKMLTLKTCRKVKDTTTARSGHLVQCLPILTATTLHLANNFVASQIRAFPAMFWPGLCLTYLCLCSTLNACFYAYFCKVFLQSFGFYDTIILLVS